ncbi:SDR family NAD(P)-dependent oxidoreductase [Gimibacter soli]|uniref:SDR family NAD(P)-dependent oxidoreductase n=1 Tax=Gimibacter soli TaxID=3024400 RepID=A0AAF0BLP2_9PROT|nr:SDR family NAD(P)-dependent oxidoreductase [Gimibacter soli]WCL53356.1 SDR family NAD(P)-dependent oxidoreductase [Gimibacter soli]
MTRAPQTVWITGAGTGIGRALALLYTADGCNVVITGRRREVLDDVVEAGRGSLGEIRALPGDVTDEAGMQALADTLRAAGMLPDIVILNAGNHIPTWAGDFRVQDYRSLMDVNYFGVVHGLAALLPLMRARGSGQIAIVASLAGYRGLPGAAAYGASKAALINMAEALRPELAREGIDLRLVNPGFIETPLTDRNEFEMPFLIDADTAARAIHKGLRGGRFEITTPRRFAFLMKILRLLPEGLFFSLTRRLLP